MSNPDKRKIVKDTGLTLLSEGKTIRIKAHGYSMYPCIKPGSLVLIEPINLKGPPVPGEIIAISRKDGMIIHRLEKILTTGKCQKVHCKRRQQRICRPSRYT